MAIETYIYCDKCGDGYAWHTAMNTTRAVMLMRQKGWTVGKYWLCPNCKRRKEKKK